MSDICDDEHYGDTRKNPRSGKDQTCAKGPVSGFYGWYNDERRTGSQFIKKAKETKIRRAKFYETEKIKKTTEAVERIEKLKKVAWNLSALIRDIIKSLWEKETKITVETLLRKIDYTYYRVFNNREDSVHKNEIKNFISGLQELSHYVRDYGDTLGICGDNLLTWILKQDFLYIYSGGAGTLDSWYKYNHFSSYEEKPLTAQYMRDHTHDKTPIDIGSSVADAYFPTIIYKYSLIKLFNEYDVCKTFFAKNMNKEMQDQCDIYNTLLEETLRLNDQQTPTLLNEQQAPIIKGCPSDGKIPQSCATRTDYLKQVLTFHPDKNRACTDDATIKFNELTDKCATWVQQGGTSKKKKPSNKKKSNKSRKNKKPKRN